MSPFDLVKQLKPLYAPSPRHPAIVQVPELSFLMIDGRGDPGASDAYEQALAALYGIAHTLKFTVDKSDPERDFEVAPLEGLWWADTEAPTIERLQAFVDAEGYDVRGRHHEIHLGDPRRTVPQRLKTIIRHPVSPHR